MTHLSAVRCAAASVLLALLTFTPACRTAAPRVEDVVPGGTNTALNQGYATLYATIRDDADIDKVLMLKRPSGDVTALVRDIAQFCRETRDQMHALRAADASLDFERQGLPQVEALTRQAISDATSKQLMFSGGGSFEVRVLLTQHEALNYITHLSATLANAEPDAERKRFLTQLSSDSAKLHQRVLSLLESARKAD